MIAIVLYLYGFCYSTPAHASNHPHDQPVSCDGEGQDGDDWLDFGQEGPALLYRTAPDGTGEDYSLSATWVMIEPGNPYFSCSIKPTEIELEHSHCELDYGASGPDQDFSYSVSDGKNFFDYEYRDYIQNPMWSQKTDPTMGWNCHTEAFNGFKGVVMEGWLEGQGYSTLREDDFFEVITANAYWAGMRISSSGHSWIIKYAGLAGKDSGGVIWNFTTRWKNGPSPVYEFSFSAYNSGDGGGNGSGDKLW